MVAWHVGIKETLWVIGFYRGGAEHIGIKAT